ncbi:hypothetical protein F7232_04600 [Corynebacterium sp. 319]|uniref:hypothetical protein n=2 Tax=unclassified Corynebacterium TaxID=2624378 RepID=UPI00125CC1A4|nr:hypothetical protein [Corynebacterium sp. 366]KAB1554246.1 hypothetical protein F7232_04600 [Corynebacterium sp. 319]
MEEAVAIAQGYADTKGGFEDYVHCGDDAFGFFTRDKPSLMKLGDSNVIVVEVGGNVVVGSVAPVYLPDDYEVRRLDGSVLQTREEVRAALEEEAAREEALDEIEEGELPTIYVELPHE